MLSFKVVVMTLMYVQVRSGFWYVWLELVILEYFRQFLFVS